MASANVTKIYSGDLPRYFGFGNQQTQTTSITANQNSNPLPKGSPYSTFQAICSSTTFGALTATVTIQVSNDLMTGQGYPVQCNTTLSTTVTSAGFFAGGLTQNQILNQAPQAVQVGMLVVGPGIPAGTYVATVTNASTIVLSAAATIVQSNVGLQFFNVAWNATALGTITLSGTTSATAPALSDGFTTVAPWRYCRAVVTNITGTGATVQVLMGE
jgi:hypothetical protein